MVQALMELTRVSKEYNANPDRLWGKKESFKAVDNISLSIKAGEIFGLIGESGSGKTTVGRIILKLIEPTSGHIFYDGDDITLLSQKDMLKYRKKMQIIFQDSASSFNPRKTIGTQMVTPMLRLGVVSTEKEAYCIVNDLLDRVGLQKHHLYLYPHEFSGGQKQRIGIARALTVRPEFLVLDEPTSALDVSIQAQILNLLLDLQKEFNLTYFLIGHNLAIIEFFCDRVAVMYKGNIVEVADTTSLYKQARHPVTRILVDAVLTLSDRMLDEKGFQAYENGSSKIPGCLYSDKCAYSTDLCKESVPMMETLENGNQYACHNPLV